MGPPMKMYKQNHPLRVTLLKMFLAIEFALGKTNNYMTIKL